ncbi:MAG TPA: hypothetical protein VJB96_01895 [Patescibacteria group bacterium]|nr:hypothetical protein [Patescibacteria group bacterium]
MIFVEWLNRDGTVLRSADVTEPQRITIHLPGRVRRIHDLSVLPETSVVRTYTPKRTRRSAFEFFTRDGADVDFNETVDDSLSIQLEERKTVQCRVASHSRGLPWESDRTAGFRVTWHSGGSPFSEEEIQSIAKTTYAKAANTLVAMQRALL